MPLLIIWERSLRSGKRNGCHICFHSMPSLMEEIPIQGRFGIHQELPTHLAKNPTEKSPLVIGRYMPWIEITLGTGGSSPYDALVSWAR